jgi:nondiscriminating aspartyl-tRNA synthetase
MQRTLTLQTTQKISQEVTIQGWIAARRNMGKIVFIDLRDRAGLVQVVLVPNELDKKSQELLSKLRPEFVLSVTGTVNERGEKQINPDLPTGKVEVLAKSFEILAEAETLPYDLNDAELKTDTLLDNAPLNLRREDRKAIFRIQASLVEGFRQYMNSQDFTEFQCPKLVGSATEGGANFFKMPYFDYEAYLAQSPQFYKQMMVGVYERAFTTGNVYRAEEHDTNRHLSEYTSLDFEMGFIHDWHDIMDMVEGAIRHMLKTVQTQNQSDLKILNADLPALPDASDPAKAKFPHMKLKQAQQIIKDEFGEDCTGEPDLEPHQEKQIGEYALKKFNSDFIYLTHYPVEKRPMYTFEDPEMPGFTGSFDLIFRGMELVTGGQRIHGYEKLKSNIKKWKLDLKDFEFYLMAFKYGMPPHGGMGMGLERFTMNLCGLTNVKHATLLPRDQIRIDLPLSKLQGKKQD